MLSSSVDPGAGSSGDGPAPGDEEEGILVAIRMRPMSPRERSRAPRVWKVLRRHASVAQTTASGQPLPDRAQGRNFFTYDRAFGESCTTRDVYDGSARSIVDSVSRGLNGTIFAYGQTSSGKTYTMQGSGTLQDGAGGEASDDQGGIVHMAARDVFAHIEREPERVFLVRVSFIEIYNEEVRDLLVSGDGSDDATLAIREDRSRGVFVDSNETIVTSAAGLLSVLFAGEKHRSVAATGMNERSSRSHTIFRITVESRLKETKKDGDEDDDGESDEDEDALRGEDGGGEGAVLVSTLNLVDLAGSESVRHTGATGDRQKEGGKINQSLLTLSRVIHSLGENARHVNFRDSKLTRILQPSLSGNARMAVICCATPSELYLEETRSTLQFASRAKLVKTRAQVNEVMDDRSLIKKLQRELKEARKAGPGREAMEQMRALEEKAVGAERANRKAEEDLRRMKKLILNGGVLPRGMGDNGSAASTSLYDTPFVYNDNDETIAAEADNFPLGRLNEGRKRRYSDGLVVNDAENVDPQQGLFSSPVRGGNAAKTKIPSRTEKKPKRPKPFALVLAPEAPGDADVALLRDALAAKSAQTASLRARLKKAERRAEAATRDYQFERLAKKDLEHQVSSLASDKEFALGEQDVIMSDKDAALTASRERIDRLMEDRDQYASRASELSALVDSLRGQLAAKEAERRDDTEMPCGQLTARDTETVSYREESDIRLPKMEGRLSDRLASLHSANEDKATLLSERELALTDVDASIVVLKGNSLATTSQLTEEVTRLRNEHEAAEERATTLELETAAKQTYLENRLQAATNQVASLQNANREATKLLMEKDTALDDAKSTVSALKEEASKTMCQMSDELCELRGEKRVLEERITTLEASVKGGHLSSLEVVGKLEAADNDISRLERENNSLRLDLSDIMMKKEEQAKEMTGRVLSMQDSSDDTARLLTEKVALLEVAEANISALKAESSEVKSQLSNEVSKLRDLLEAEKVAATTKLDEEKGKLEEADKSNTMLMNQVTTLQNDGDYASKLLTKKQMALDHAQSTISSLRDNISQLSKQVAELRSANMTAEERASALEDKLAAEQVEAAEKLTDVEDKAASLQDDNEDVTTLLEEADAQNNIVALKEESSNESQHFSAKEAAEKRSATLAAEQAATTAKLTVLEGKLDAATKQVASLQNANDDATKLLLEKDAALGDANSTIKALKEEASQTTLHLSEEVSELRNALKAEQAATASKLDEVEVKLEEASKSNSLLADQVTTLQNDGNDASKLLTVKEAALDDAKSTISSLREDTSRLSEQVVELRSANMAAEERAIALESKLEANQVVTAAKLAEVEDKAASLQGYNKDVMRLLEGKEASLMEAQLTIAELKEESSSEVSELINEKELIEKRTAVLEDKLDKEQAATSTKLKDLEGKLEVATKQVASLENANNDATKLLLDKDAALDDAKSCISALKEEASQTRLKLSEEVAELRGEKGALSERLTTLQAKFEGERVVSQEMVDQLQAAKDDIVRLARENNILQSDLSGMKREKEEQASTLQDTAHSLQVATDEKKKYDRIKEEGELLRAKLEAIIHHKDQEANALANDISMVSLERDELARKVESLKDGVASYSSQLEELQSKLANLGAERDTSEKRVEELMSSMKSNRETTASVQRENDDLVLKLRAAGSDMNEFLKEAELAIHEKENMLAEIEGKHREAIKEYTQDSDLLKRQVLEATSQITDLTNELSAVYVENKELAAKVESLTSGITTMQNEAETKVSKLESSIESLTAEYDAANGRVSELMSRNMHAEVALSSLKVEKDELTSSLDANKTDIARLERAKEEGVSEVTDLQNSVAKLQSQMESLMADLGTTKSENSDLKSQIEVAAAKNNSIASEQKRLTDKLERIADEKAKLASELSSKIQLAESSLRDKATIETKFNSTITDLEANIKRKTEEAHTLNADISLFTVQVSKLTQEKDELMERVEKAMANSMSLTTERDNAEAEKEMLVTKVDQCITQLDLERADAEKKIARAESKVDELFSQAKKAEANYKALESEKDEVEAKFKETVAGLKLSLAGKSQEICNLNDKLKSLNNQVTSKSDNHAGQLDSINALKQEILELKSLLSLANASVEEARSAALSADQELEEKEIELDASLRSAAEHEEARRNAEDKLRLAEQLHRNCPSRANSEEELLRDMEVLLGEKIDAESRLEQEFNRRKEVEDELKRAAEEEKQLLMDEAEEKMLSLREEISQLKSDLARVESNCYSMKAENEDLHDNISRLEASATDAKSITTSMRDELSREKAEKKDLQTRLDSLEEQSTAFKNEVFAAKASFEAEAQARLTGVEDQLSDALLQLEKWRNEAKLSRETIGGLNNEIEEYQREIDSVKGMAANEKELEMSKLREDLAQTKVNHSTAEASCLLAKRELEHARDRWRAAEEKQQKFAAKAKGAIETLKDRLVKAESTQKDSVARAEVKNLQAEMNELKSTLHDKDQRIKKLEKSKITKSQIASIQRLKDERSQFMAEAKEYKQRVDELENPRPRRSGLRERKGSSHDPAKEIERLQSDVRKCENKLRKYVQHCERLEKDRKGVMEAISSSDAKDIVGDGVVEMVVSLCDKLALVEKECDALASSEGKAAEYLRQLDSLSEKYSLLESEAQSYKQNEAELNSTLSECKASLLKAQDNIVTLIKDKETLQAMAESAKGNMSGLLSEKKRQMYYLESENLQLGDELKKTKKELSIIKADLDTGQKSTLSSKQTEELQGLSNLLGPSSKTRAAADSASQNVSLLSGTKRALLSPHRKRCPERSSNEECDMDKENVLNKKRRIMASPFSSAKKKTRSVNPFSSVKKSARRTRKALADDTPTKQYALGDSEPTADVTGECNQS